MALRPLRVEELAEILAFDFKSGPIPKFRRDWRLKNPVKALLSACSTLLAVVTVESYREKCRVVQFAHFTVKEFLMSSRFAEKHDAISSRYHISISPAHSFVAQACLGVLLHLDDNTTRRSLTEFPLAKYAAQHWVQHTHFGGVSQCAMEGIKRLFDRTKPHLSIWLWIHDPTMPSWMQSERSKGPSSPRGTPLHYSTFCGLHDITKILAVEYPQDVNSQNFDNRSSPLHIASIEGHVNITRMLVDCGADVSAQKENGRTALHLALEKGHVELARILVESGARLSAQDKHGWTALHMASNKGYVDISKMLVECGADVSAQKEDGRTALHLASERGHVDLAWVLMESGAGLSAQMSPCSI